MNKATIIDRCYRLKYRICKRLGRQHPKPMSANPLELYIFRSQVGGDVTATMIQAVGRGIVRGWYSVDYLD